MAHGQGGILLASGGEDIKLWDLTSATPVQQISPHTESIANLSWSHNNQFLASASTAGDKIVLNYIKGSSNAELASGDNQTSITLNSSSRYLACSGKNRTVTVWDLKTKKMKKQYKGHKSTVTCIRFNWNDSHIASGSSSGEVVIHNVASGLCGNPLSIPTGQPIRNLQYSYFKKSYLAAVSDDGGLYLWDTNIGRLLATFSNSHKAPATDLSFSPNNNLLLASCGLDKKIVCYDVMGKQIIKSMAVDAPLTSLAFFHDGATLAAGSSRGKIFIFDLRKGDIPLKALVGHKSSVQCLCFQSDLTTAKVNGPSSKSATPSPHVNKGIMKKVNSSRQQTGRLQHSTKETVNNEHHFDSVKPVSREGPPSSSNSFDNGVISPMNDGNEGTNNHSSESLVSAETNNYSNSSLTDGGIFSPMQQTIIVPDRTSMQTSPSPPLSVIPPPLDNSANIPASVRSDSYQSRIDSKVRSEKNEPEMKDISNTQAGAIHKRGKSPQIQSSGDSSIESHKDATARTSCPSQPQETPEASPGAASHSMEPFQVEFIRNMIEDAMEEFKDDIHRDMVNLHVEVIRQFHIQQMEMKALLEKYSVNDALLVEVERLKEEVRRLKGTF